MMIYAVTDDDFKKSRRLISKQLRRSGIYEGTAKLRRAKGLKFMEMSTEQWERREAVSFNRDCLIGVAGWADENSLKRLLLALVERSEWMSEKIDMATRSMKLLGVLIFLFYIADYIRCVIFQSVEVSHEN